MQLSLCYVHSMFGAASRNIRIDDLGSTAVWLSSYVLICPHMSSSRPLDDLWPANSGCPREDRLHRSGNIRKCPPCFSRSLLLSQPHQPSALTTLILNTHPLYHKTNNTSSNGFRQSIKAQHGCQLSPVATRCYLQGILCHAKHKPVETVAHGG